MITSSATSVVGPAKDRYMRSADLLSPFRSLWTLITAGRSDVKADRDGGSRTTVPAAEQDYERVAFKLLERLDNPSWVLRRVEEVCVIGRRLAQRTVWAVVQVKPPDADKGVGDDAIAFLPLNRFEKKPNAPERVFSVRDNQGAIVPALVPEDRDNRVVEALMAAVAKWLPDGDDDWRDSLTRGLRKAVAAAEPDAVREKLQDAQNGLRSQRNDRNTDVIERLSTVFETVAGLRLLLIPVRANGEPHCFSFDYTVEGDFHLARRRDGAGGSRHAWAGGRRASLCRFPELL
jgi:hypothetical protein